MRFSLHTLVREKNDLREREALCNATVVSKDGASFRVHSAVLMACSDFFKAAFEFGPRSGAKGVEKPIVRLPNVTADVLEVILRFTYLKEIELNCSNVWRILLAADFLQIDLLSRACFDFMAKNLSLPKSVKIIEMTQGEIYMPEVQRMATAFVLHNLCKPSYRLRGQQKAALAQLRPETLIRLLQDDALNAAREQYVWQTVVEWLEDDPEKRTQHLDTVVVGTIRFGLLPKTFVSHNVLGHPMVRSSPELVRKIQELDLAVDQVLSAEISADPSEIPVVVQPRLPHTVVLSVGGWVNGAPSNEMQLYDINADAWAEVSALESSNPDHTMAYHGLARLEDDLYVIGGTESGTDTTRCLKLSLRTFKWEVLASLNQSRDFVSVVALNERIYAIGGRSDPHHQRNFSAEYYDPLTNKWYPIAPMHHCRSDAGCTVHAGEHSIITHCASLLAAGEAEMLKHTHCIIYGLPEINFYLVRLGKIYVVGGFTGETVLSSSEVYDPQQNTWELLPDMITPRSGVRCVTLRKHIYAIGGFSGSVRLASVERFDPDRMIWIPMEPMLTPRSNLAVAVIGDDILAVGGYNGRSVDDANEVYNVFEDKWYSLEPLPSPRSALNMLTIEDASNLALRLLGPNRALPNNITTDRAIHRPEYGAILSPNAELPAGQPHYEMEDDDSESWQDALDPFGLSLVVVSDEGGNLWGPVRFFADMFADNDSQGLGEEEAEWVEEDDDDDSDNDDEDEEDQGDVDETF